MRTCFYSSVVELNQFLNVCVCICVCVISSIKFKLYFGGVVRDLAIPS